MERKIKLIWDMHGPHAKGTAAHHAVHLSEYAERNAVEQFGFGSEPESASHSVAFLVVKEKDMITVRDALRPHRAEIWEN